ncbi:MAG: primosomal protein N' [Pseudomonadota bacterium]
MNRTPILRVAVNVPLARLFDYLPPPGTTLPVVGARIRVPFGRRSETGVVIGHGTDSALPVERLKRATAVLDDEALLAADDLALLRFTGDYYHHPFGEVVAAALPLALRAGKPLQAQTERLALTENAAADSDGLVRRAPRQAALLGLLRERSPEEADVAALGNRMPDWRRAARALAAKGLLRFETCDTSDPQDVVRTADGPTLNADQEAAVNAVQAAEGFRAFVLDGVTGSGKTEVYLRLIEQVITAGLQVLVLVPEIGLTPQLVRRFERRLGFAPAALHSSLTDSERLVAWRRARNGAARLLVGTRSAVFTPMPKLGLVIVDEEHDHSFKQQEGLRYSARDLALVRAKHSKVPIVLGSATPTLEVLKQCADGHYEHLELPKRAGNAQPPSLRLVDLSRQAAQDGLSDALKHAVREHLDAGGQVLLFLNRRGFAPTLICSNCAWIAECARCDSRMTVHAARNELRCHHCGASRPLEDICPKCTGNMRPLGEGTERLERSLSEAFPDAHMLRIDSDSMQKKGAMQAALADASSGRAEILIGTQMLSKGHHFPKLSLVGIVNADQGLFGSDFRSAERLAQSIVQVAGRAGRVERPGTVLIQTAFPEHPFWARLLNAGYAGIVEDALAERRLSGWPPYARLALLRASAHQRRDAAACLDVARRHLDGLQYEELRVLGPVDAPLARKAGRYRMQLLLESKRRQVLHAALASLTPVLEESKAARRARWSVDVDPIQLF